MKRGVLSATCGEGGKFHGGIEGSSGAECAAAARGKLSMIGSAIWVGCALYLGVGLTFMGLSPWLVMGIGVEDGVIPMRR